MGIVYSFQTVNPEFTSFFRFLEKFFWFIPFPIFRRSTAPHLIYIQNQSLLFFVIQLREVKSPTFFYSTLTGGIRGQSVQGEGGAALV